MIRKISFIASWLALLAIIFFAIQVNRQVPKPNPGKQDVYYSFLEGQRINDGVNPYVRILNGDMRANNKYATYFPLFYEMSFISQKLGLAEFPRWIIYWGLAFQLFEYATAILLYGVLASQKMEWGGVFAASFWLFNRWSLKMVETINLDFIPIFFMLAALLLSSRHKKLGLILLSFSLAFKQIGIFIAPLFVIWVWLSAPDLRSKIRQSLAAIGIIVSIPLLSSLPFLVWNANGLVRSILFSATRLAENHFSANSLDVIMGWDGLLARVPMLLMILAVYLMVWKELCQKYAAALLIFAIFITFNSVLYQGYMTWFVSLFPLLIVEQFLRVSKLKSSSAT